MEEKVWLLIEGERVKWQDHRGVSYSGRTTTIKAALPGVENKTATPNQSYFIPNCRY